jgi:hypothetical protein
MFKKYSRSLWIITVVVALLLTGVTINLAIKANAEGGESGQHVRAYLQSDEPLIIILSEPEYRSIVTSIQQDNTPIVVTEYLRRSGEDWYRINVNETEAGWVQGRYISLERP